MRHPHEQYGRQSPEGAGHRGGARGHGGPHGPGHHGQDRDAPAADGASGWFAGRLPDSWGTAEIAVDRDELTVMLTVEPPATDGAEAHTDADVAAAEAGRATRWREDTREERVQIAREAEHRFGRKVAWGVTVGSTGQLFTHLAVPVMTRLRQPERQVLDTLVDSGVARSRAEAVAWCVKLVGRNADSWLAELREAMQAVEKVREQGPVTAP
jgi:hypothetical protein